MVCNGQLASYARTSDRLREVGLNPVGISVDTVEQNKNMVEKLMLDFPLLSDPDGKVIKAFDVWNPEEGGIARTSTFVIAPNRRIVFKLVGDIPGNRPTNAEVMAAAAEARSASKGTS